MADAAQRLGELLVRAGVITASQRDDAVQVHVATASPLGKVLVELGYASHGAILAVVAKQIGIEYMDLSERRPEPGAVALIPREVATRYMLMPLEIRGNTLLVAMADPQNVLTIDHVRIITGHEIRPAISTKNDILEAIRQYYDVADRDDSDLRLETDEPDDEELGQLADVESEAPAVKLVNYIIQKAVNDRASDIHIEPQQDELRVRFRVDGVLVEATPPIPKSTQASIISRFKIMADMDISESRRPQDGHCSVSVGGQKLDVRVSSLPTVFGERMVLRLLRKDSILLQLSDLGFLPSAKDRFEAAFTKPYGAVLVTGPTGSGKSTTLYAAVNVLNDPSRHIMTAEDPVEYRLAGVNQCQVNPKLGMTFARALRSFLRCSPDVILVGEIRDQETAKIAIESALTGHLVLSTLHTNDSASAITRLIEMGVEPFLVSSAVDCVLAQRLARRLCPECRQAWTPESGALIKLGYDADSLPDVVYRAVGCRKCGGTGYKGRLGVHEVLLVSDEIRRLCVSEASVEEIRRTAIEQGMRTLRQDGLEKVRQGLTSVEEIVRVIV
ncbi:MAG: Flp pilus assembly complex ATPase component TadA [Coriobacteriia bacterium]|nr:Flp pilus assembly complex ATPase component TadA [Coriobacteriia bacterium]